MVFVDVDTRIQHSSASKQWYVSHFGCEIVEGTVFDDPAVYILHCEDVLDETNPDHVRAAVAALRIDFRPEEGDSIEFSKTLRNKQCVDAVLSLKAVVQRVAFAA